MDLEQLSQPLERLATLRSDPDAWEALYQALWPYLIGVLFRQFRADRTLSEDAAQEVMYRLLKHADFGTENRSPQAFLSYVNIVCRSVAGDWYRGQGSEPAAEDVAELPLPDHAASDPEAALITRDLLEKVSCQLSPEELHLAQSLVNGTSAQEAADDLNLNLPTYYQRVSRLRKRLRLIAGNLSDSA